MVDVRQLHKQIQTLKNGDDATCRQVIHAIRLHEPQEWTRVPPDAVDALVESLRLQLVNHELLRGVKQPSIHKEVAAILGILGPRSKTAIGPLVDLLRDGVLDAVRESAVVALGKIGRDAKPAVGRLIELCHGRTALAVHAIRALGDIGCADQRVRAVLIELWKSPTQTQNVQVQVAHALCKLKIEAENVPYVLTTTLMTSQDAHLRKAAAEALAWCGKDDIDVVPALLTASTHDKSEDVQQVARTGLEQLKVTPEKAVKVCAVQLSESTYAEAALRKSGALAVPALTEAVGSSDATACVKALRTLATMGEVAAASAPALTHALRHRDEEVRLAAAKALWNVTKSPDDAVPVLIQLLQQKRVETPENGEARRMFLQTIIEALWRIGPPAEAAVPALRGKLKDKNRLISESARNAIKKIAPTAAV